MTTDPAFTIGFVLCLPSSADPLAVVRAVTQAAALTLSGDISVDPVTRLIQVHITGEPTHYGAWRQITPQMDITAWWLEFVQAGEITETPIPAPPWWQALKAGNKVKPLRDNVPILYANGTLRGRGKATDVYTVWEPAVDSAKQLVCVFNGPAIPGGLWISVSDLAPA